MTTPKQPRRRKNDGKRLKKAMTPPMDTPGVVARNEKYIQMLLALQAFLPQVTTEHSLTQKVEVLIKKLGIPPKTVFETNSRDRSMSSEATSIILDLKKELSDVEDIGTKKTLKTHIDKLHEMASDLGIAHGAPRNMKEVLARNLLGLQPQDVRAKGVAKTLFKETVADMKVLFGADASKMVQRKNEEGRIAEKGALVRHKARHEDHETALMMNEDYDDKKMRDAHEEALTENRERNKAKERDEVHEEALKENEERDAAVANGTTLPVDAIRDKELIHAQALDIEEDTEKQREEAKALEANKPKERQKAAEKIEAYIENEQDDSVASEILETVKNIEKILEKDEKKKDGAKSEKEKAPKDTATEKEEQLQAFAKKLGIKLSDPEERKKAEAMMAKGTISSTEATATPLEKVVGVEEGHTATLGRVEDKEEALAMALRQDKKMKVRAAYEEATALNERIDEERKEEKGLVENKGKAYRMAVRVNNNIDRRAAQLPPEMATVGDSSSVQAPAITPTEATVEDSPSVKAPELAPQEPSSGGGMMDTAGGVVTGNAVTRGARGILGGARRMLGRGGGALRGVGGTAARIGAMGVGSSALATGAVAVGGLYAGWKIGSWANRRLGLQSEGERMNEAADKRTAEVSENAERVAREHGYTSFAAMQSANRSRAQLQQQETRTGAVEGLERGSIEERIQVPTTPAPVTPPVVNNNYASPAPAPAPASGNQTVFIRPVHPSFMRYQEKRMTRTLFPQNSV